MSITRAQPDAVEAAPDGFDDVYRAHFPRCHRVAYRVTRDHHLAEDAAQEALFDYARHPHNFDSARGTLSTWLTILTHRRAVDLVRREQSHARRVNRVESLLPTQPDLTPDPEARTVNAAVHAELRAAMSRLSVPQQQVLFLVFDAEHTERATAQVLTVPLGTVKSRKGAAVRALRGSLGHLEADWA